MYSPNSVLAEQVALMVVRMYHCKKCHTVQTNLKYALLRRHQYISLTRNGQVHQIVPLPAD